MWPIAHYLPPRALSEKGGPRTDTCTITMIAGRRAASRRAPMIRVIRRICAGFGRHSIACSELFRGRTDPPHYRAPGGRSVGPRGPVVRDRLPSSQLHSGARLSTTKEDHFQHAYWVPSDLAPGINRGKVPVPRDPCSFWGHREEASGLKHKPNA
jgi:hypothetical protein